MVLVLIIFSFILIKITSKMIDKQTSKTKALLADFKLNNWIISKKDLYALPPWRFEEWCAGFLERMGYSEIQILSDRDEGGKNIICKYGNSPVYIECFQTYVKDEQIDKDEYYSNVDRPAIQKLVGTMFHDNVNKGIVLTTGYFSKCAEDYAAALPADYKIDLINGDMLSMKTWDLVQSKI